MFCRKCGFQMDDDLRFCPKCGVEVIPDEIEKSNITDNIVENVQTINEEKTYVESSQDVKFDSSEDKETKEENRTYYNEPHESEQNEKINWKEFLTIDNIERFAPIASMIPLAMVIVCVVLNSIITAIIGKIGIIGKVFAVVFILLKLLFVLGTVAATAGLIYVIIKKKYITIANAWVAPFATFLAFLSCLGIAFKINAIAWIFGIIAILLGLELLARVVIAELSITSAINPLAGIKTYKKYYADYREKYPSTRDLEKAGIKDAENSSFDGSGFELLGNILLTIIVSALTCGLAAPWMICRIYKWKVNHTIINGKRLVFNGSGASLFGNWVLWEILTGITCGLYGFFLHVALRKWELKHTYIDGEPITANGKESYFDGGSFVYFGYGIISTILLIVTCGLAYPWVMALLQKWDTKHQTISNRRLVFSGSGLGFLGEFIIIFILSIVTLGIYAPWGVVRMNKYIIRNTDFVA